MNGSPLLCAYNKDWIERDGVRDKSMHVPSETCTIGLDKNCLFSIMMLASRPFESSTRLLWYV